MTTKEILNTGLERLRLNALSSRGLLSEFGSEADRCHNSTPGDLMSYCGHTYTDTRVSDKKKKPQSNCQDELNVILKRKI